MTISDLHAEIRLLTDTDSTSYTDANILRRINSDYEQVIGWIINSDGFWQFDDTNYTDQPRGTGTLVEGQQDYAFNSDYLQVEMIEIKDDDGYWHKIKQLDRQELGDLAPEEYFGQDSSGNPNKGFPDYYDILGDFVRLYPSPTSTDVTLSGGLRISFKRTADVFTSAQVTTGTKEPGFATPFHIILAYMVAIPYCMAFKKDRVALYKQRVAELKQEILDHYSKRNKDAPPVLTMKPIEHF